MKEENINPNYKVIKINKIVDVDLNTGDYENDTVFDKQVYLAKSLNDFMLVMPNNTIEIHKNDNVLFEYEGNSYGSVWTIIGWIDGVQMLYNKFNYKIETIEMIFI